MARRLFALTALLFVCACAGPVTVWYDKGTPGEQADRDLLACRVKGAQSVPVDQRIDTTPIYTTPTRTLCKPARHDPEATVCTTTGGEVSGGRTYSYDANEDLRADVVAQCMADLGYTQVSLPRCTTQQETGALDFRRHPELTPQTCVTRASGSDSWRIVTPLF